MIQSLLDAQYEMGKNLTGILTTFCNEQKDPTSEAEVKSSPDSLKWEKAIESEMKSLHSNGVWELVEPPLNQKIVGSK